MPRKKKDKLEIDPESSKSTIEGFRGGMRLPLDSVMSDGTKLRSKLEIHIREVFDKEKSNQRNLEDNLTKWQKIYFGQKEPKSWPFPNCSNVAVPITRSAVDTVFVRIIDAIFNKTKVWIVKARKEEFIDLANEVEDGLDWFQRNILHLKKKIMSPLMQGLKTGTGIGELVYEEKRRTIYRYATPEEEKDTTIHKYPLPKTSTRGIKDVKTL